MAVNRCSRYLFETDRIGRRSVSESRPGKMTWLSSSEGSDHRSNRSEAERDDCGENDREELRDSERMCVLKLVILLQLTLPALVASSVVRGMERRRAVRRDAAAQAVRLAHKANDKA